MRLIFLAIRQHYQNAARFLDGPKRHGTVPFSGEPSKRNDVRDDVGCHDTELQVGVPNPNAQGGEVPSLLHVADDYTKGEVIRHYPRRQGAPLDNPAGPTPPLYIPSWKHVLSDEDIQRVADYLWSKQQKKESW
jgi:hypothetical protein